MNGADVPGVFVNCPFDQGYQQCHHAILLCVVACGLEPRSALETGSASTPRMKRISIALQESSYSIHDLTRAHGDPTSSNLARFNMPFEFGMAFLFADGGGHDWLALLPAAHPHGEFISDLAGYDLDVHDGTPEALIPPVLAWLSSRPSVEPLPPSVNPRALIELLPDLAAHIAAQELVWGQYLPWQLRVQVIRDLVASRLP